MATTTMGQIISSSMRTSAGAPSRDMQPWRQDSVLRERADLVRRTYGTVEQLKTAFDVSRQADVCRNERVCFLGYRMPLSGTVRKAPRLMDVNHAYGDGTAEEWLTYQLGNLAMMSGAKRPMTADQIAELAVTVVADSEFRLLNMAEVMLFCQWMKAGRYEKFYGSVDPMAITKSLRQFCRQRKDRLAEYYRQDEEARARAEAAQTEAITYEEYLRRKQENENDDRKD